MHRLAKVGALALLTSLGCGRAQGEHAQDRGAPARAPAAPDPLQPLREFETARRGATDFAHAPASDTILGTDPYALALVPRPVAKDALKPRLVGLLRGRSAIVVLDDSLHETARLDAPASASSLAVTAEGDIFVAGELSHVIQRYRFIGQDLKADGTIVLPDVLAIRGLATGPERALYVVEEHDGRLITLHPAAEGPHPVDAARSIAFQRADEPVGHGPMRVLRAGPYVAVDCLLDHALVVQTVGADGVPGGAPVRIVHDGPMWGFDGVIEARAGEAPALLIAAGGVEDHPLDRTGGSFAFVDSFVYLYRVDGGGATPLAAVNASALGMITPKALSLSVGSTGAIDVDLAAYGSPKWARLEWPHEPAKGASPETREPTVTMHDAPPGTAAMTPLADGSFAAANPLIDAWVKLGGHGSPAQVDVVHVDDARSRGRSVDSRVGEALFFTSLMAPWDKSDGPLSRFTCETCHFEGYIDGRTHHTGRGDVHATTKPLLGLFNNKPHFSRALDPNLTTVADNEFRVAGAKSDHDPWFTVAVHDFPWITELGVEGDAWTPDHLRRALMTFLMEFSHRPNPAVAGRKAWTASERKGAEVFQSRCESCHSSRLVTDDPTTHVPFDRWESLVLAPEGALVWARAEYEKTGVTPYVNESGARVVSLRRLWKKYPYFTNGSAKDLRSVLDRVRYGDKAFFHSDAPAEVSLHELDAPEKDALLAFMNLL